NLAEEEKMVVQALEKAEAIRIAEIDQGRFEGRFEEKIRTAQMMLKRGEALEKIVEYTDLSTREIQALQTNSTTEI
ncbi:MAG: hypothetical protein FWG66_01255, partial [Spirochaetes bacterium]|nr:hypothetical protein [Spirochaetota bacterium]